MSLNSGGRQRGPELRSRTRLLRTKVTAFAINVQKSKLDKGVIAARKTQADHPKKSFSSTQDFSENGSLKPKYEHQGRYFKEIGCTLFGIVVEVNVCDMRDEFFEGVVNEKNGAETKAALLEMYLKENLPPVCTFTVLIVSSDLVHDPAAVQRFNDFFLTPFMKENKAAELSSWEVHFADSDGAPTQFDNATQYLWISYQQAKSSIKMDWTLNCPCHGKNKVDPENGAAKNLVLLEMLTETDLNQERRIESAFAASKFLSERFSKPYEDIFVKKGLGILKRVVFYVPATGPGSIDRNIVTCKTL